MTVNGVNNSNNNAGAYAAGAAVVGGGAGAAYGYLSKPFLKDGAPTDTFIKKMGEKMKDQLTPEQKALSEAIENDAKELATSLENVKSVEEYKSTYINKMFGKIADIDDIELNEFKQIQNQVFTSFEQLGLKTSPEVLEQINSAQSVGELKNIMGKIFDKEFEGKSLDAIKDAAKKQAKEFEREMGKGIFNQFWDADQKAFVNCEDGIGKAVKNAAQSIQLKTAGIYGGIAAAVLGLGTYLCCAGKKAPEAVPEQKVDAQA